jgi:hypothetical protein
VQVGLTAVLNTPPAAALALNSAVHHAWPSMVLNAVWFLVAAVTLSRPVGQQGYAASPVPEATPQPAGSAVAASR